MDPKLGFLVWKQIIWQPRSEKCCNGSTLLIARLAGKQIRQWDLIYFEEWLETNRGGWSPGAHSCTLFHPQATTPFCWRPKGSALIRFPPHFATLSLTLPFYLTRAKSSSHKIFFFKRRHFFSRRLFLREMAVLHISVTLLKHVPPLLAGKSVNFFARILVCRFTCKQAGVNKRQRSCKTEKKKKF
jgi:hypothetical protein